MNWHLQAEMGELIVCSCVIEWATDKSTEGVHNQVPVHCSEVIKELKKRVIELENVLALGGMVAPGGRILSAGNDASGWADNTQTEILV